MKKNTLINATMIILFSLIAITLIIMVLIGDNGLINKEMENYNNTHNEEKIEKQEQNVLVMGN